MRRIRRGARRAPGPRREVDWVSFGFIDANGVGVGGTSYSLIDAQDITLKDGKCTVERVVGRAFIYDLRDAVGAPSNFCSVHAGILVQQLDQAGNVPATSPSNVTDAELPWLWRKSWTVLCPSGLVPDFTVVGHTQGYRYIDFDVHVRRKLSDRDNLLFIINVVAVPAPGMELTNSASLELTARTLVKLT